jgi:hypothetical protein
VNDSSLSLKCHRERWAIEIALRIALLKPQKMFDCRDSCMQRQCLDWEGFSMTYSLRTILSARAAQDDCNLLKGFFV